MTVPAAPPPGDARVPVHTETALFLARVIRETATADLSTTEVAPSLAAAYRAGLRTAAEAIEAIVAACVARSGGEDR